MASGGLPQVSMPPPRGWNPGGPQETTQSEHDFNIANEAWEVRIWKCKQSGKNSSKDGGTVFVLTIRIKLCFFGQRYYVKSSGLEFTGKCQNLMQYWAFLGSDPCNMRLKVDIQAERVRDLIRYVMQNRKNAHA